MNNREKIVHLYQKYGFIYRGEFSNSDFLAFTFQSGFFNNAEVISLNDNSGRIIELMNESANELEQLGFSVKKTFYDCIEDIEKALFDGFFHIEDWKNKIRQEYQNHCDKTLSIIPSASCEYKYVDVPYLKNEKALSGNLIKDICLGFNKFGPQLSIIEAPAGFGKTCTSFEIINDLVNSSENTQLPFFTEFSRDRQARVFQHILVQEVDRSFSSVKSNVVIDEVKNGKIVIVLDGFDELLHDNSTDLQNNDEFDNSEPMLDTISELLTSNAKIVLTSRRSAIFDSESFNNWVERNRENFEINRYRLSMPRINDWLSSDRITKLKKHNIYVKDLSNPVLLSFLRCIDNNDFDSICENPENILDVYFSTMLDREMERQALNMSQDQQKKVLSAVANDMCENNYTADTKENLIDTIKKLCGDLLHDVRLLYSNKDRPSIDKLATTLSNHAFFDRSSNGENNIEFINEFVFGNYISENILNSDDEWIAGNERFVEPAVLSYSPRPKENKILLWSKLHPMLEFLDKSSVMRFESILNYEVGKKNYSNSDINSVEFKSTTFFSNTSASNIVFFECTFKKSEFFLDDLTEITFYNCNFWDCSFVSSSSGEINFYNCQSNNSFIQDIENTNVELESDNNNAPIDIREYILDSIWPKGSNNIDKLYFFTGNLFKNNELSKKEILKEIKKLKRDNILLDNENKKFIFLNKDKVSDVKKILGRA